MLKIDEQLTPADLLPGIERMWEVSARCIRSIDESWNPDDGSPVFTVDGKYTAQGWTEWTQGFPVRLGLAAVRRHGRERVS